MKKYVALLLSLAMVLSLTSCESSKSSKDVDSKLLNISATEDTESTETKPTDLSTTETTEESTSDTVPTETETTPSDTVPSDTTETTPAPGITLPSGFTISHNLDKLEIYRETEYLGCGKVEGSGDDMKVGRASAALYYLYDMNENSPLGKALKSRYEKNSELVGKVFSRLQKELELTGTGEYWIDFNQYYIEPEVLRADSEILSFIEGAHNYSFIELKDSELYQPSSGNYRVKDGSVIELTDVVKDLDALVKIVEEKSNPSEYGYDELIKSVKDGTARFGILYDGIYLPDVGKIPVIGNETLFDLSYFGNTTATDYTVRFDRDWKLEWDVDGDNVLDKITLSIAKDPDSDSIGKLSILFNNDTYEYTSEQIEYLENDMAYNEGMDSFVAFTDNGTFLFVLLEDFMFSTHVILFKVDGGKLVPLDDYVCGVREICDPSDLLISEGVEGIGINSGSNRVRISENGELLYKSIYFDVYDGPYITRVDLPGVMTDLWATDGGDTVIPKGSVVSIIRYIDDYDEFVAEVHNEDESKSYYVLLQKDREGKIGGYSISEAFIGVSFGE